MITNESSDPGGFVGGVTLPISNIQYGYIQKKSPGSRMSSLNNTHSNYMYLLSSFFLEIHAWLCTLLRK